MPKYLHFHLSQKKESISFSFEKSDHLIKSIFISDMTFKHFLMKTISKKRFSRVKREI